MLQLGQQIYLDLSKVFVPHLMKTGQMVYAIKNNK